MAQVFKATFVHGRPCMIDYTNNTTNTVNAGDVVMGSNSIRIAHADIAPGALGALSIGIGCYDFVSAGSNGANTPVADGNLIRYDSTNGWAQGGTATNNLKIGPAEGAAGTTAAVIRAILVPGLNL
jgi:hypothetical protein